MKQDKVKYVVGRSDIRVGLIYKYDEGSAEARWYVGIEGNDFTWELLPDGSIRRTDEPTIPKRNTEDAHVKKETGNGTNKDEPQSVQSGGRSSVQSTVPRSSENVERMGTSGTRQDHTD